jgi:hypothetical protein
MKTSTIIPGAFAALLLYAAVITASAQDRPTSDPKGCAPGERMQTDGKAPDAKPGDSLSDKLARTDGVICPPNVDPEIKAPTPQVGKMPIIPPPGSPGGDQSVQPK